MGGDHLLNDGGPLRDDRLGNSDIAFDMPPLFLGRLIRLHLCPEQVGATERRDAWQLAIADHAEQYPARPAVPVSIGLAEAISR